MSFHPPRCNWFLKWQPVCFDLLPSLDSIRVGITSGQYERAFELHTPLMTSYFAETGAWILAAKRLIEVAKMCLR